MAALFSGTLVAHGEECQPPPVTTASHAICLAKRFVAARYAENPPRWELGYEAKEMDSYWFVHYHPTTRVLGGAGDLEIEKSSGTVKFIRGYK